MAYSIDNKVENVLMYLPFSCVFLEATLVTSVAMAALCVSLTVATGKWYSTKYVL